MADEEKKGVVVERVETEEGKKNKKELEELKNGFKKTRKKILKAFLWLTIFLVVDLILGKTIKWKFTIFIESLTGISPVLIYFLDIILLLGWYATYSVKIIQEYETGLVQFLGRFAGKVNPGLAIVPYPFYKIRFVQMWEKQVDIRKQKVETSDMIDLLFNAIIWYRIIDPYKAVFNVEDISNSIGELILGTIRDIVGEIKAEKVITSQKEIIEQIQDRLAKEGVQDGEPGEEQIKEGWGVKIRLQIQEISLPENLQKAYNEKAAADEEAKKIRTINKAINESDPSYRIRMIDAIRETSNAKLLLAGKDLPLIQQIGGATEGG
ncbi:MAG: hypothetical protein GF387_02225 [Candidatus Portnoybacteria bacterium]|nr:hypothetical protein [Candidatus Portnoybacteria bacterium]